MYVPVDFCVLNKLTDKPVGGVLVKVFAVDGKGVYGEMVSTSDGKVGFLLNGPQRYQARAYKYGVDFTNPLYFDVSTDSGVSNQFRIDASLVAVPASTDPRLCLCSGYFRTPSGGPAAGLDIRITNRFSPLLLEGAGILSENVRVVTDPQGWMSVPLIRFGEYDVLLEGLEDTARIIYVPDAASCNFPDLVFEIVDKVIIDSELLQVRQGQTIDVYPEVYTSVGRKLDGTAKGRVCWKVGDLDTASLTIGWDKLVLYGNAKGTTVLTATRSETNLVRIPDPPIFSGLPIQVV